MSKLFQVTAQQRANLEDALNNMWPSVPEENVIKNLNYWRQGAGSAPVNCKTIACFGGWCALWPPFQAQGVSASPVGYPTVTGDPLGIGTACDLLFGIPALFASRGCHVVDKQWGPRTSDHKLVANRLRWALENSEVVS